ncbi:diacylglycerol kinase family protein [uncultured Chryseobacterium sp.]|uniref:diacylglycerol/lipid kinase family protein n=1 Tax=uncultured Chryseobacterium sp. TaxID=259322 RepID=UPI0026171110|nr:YegS/Rv2252/BmrU family lipid kinase [uncultured Chryseobacterium sp.]
MKTAFLINPTILHYKKILHSIENEFNGMNYEIFVSEYHGHFMKLCDDVLSKGFTNLIAVGGDGTLNEVLNGTIHYFSQNKTVDFESLRKIKIGVLPCGSGNDFVRNFSQEFDVKHLKINIQNNSFESIDIGKCTFQNEKREEETRYFINIADLGMGAETMKVKEKIPVWSGAKFRYFFSILSTLLVYKKKELQLISNDFEWKGKCLNLVVANGKYFGNGLGIAPKASVSDGKFDITVVGNISLVDYALNIGKVKKSKPLEHREIHYFKGKSFEVKTLSGEEALIDIDGEVSGFSPAKFEILEKTVNFIV